jgi:glycosyltransferase involved in cell wall biosynthesis
LQYWAYGPIIAVLLGLLDWRQRIAQRLFFGRAGPVSGPVVVALRRCFGGAIRRMEPEFDADFYLRQIPDAFGQASAGGDPILHYVLLGHYVGLSPNRSFEPRFYRERNPRLSIFTPPFLDYLRRGRAAGEFANHLETRKQPLGAVAKGGKGVALVLDHPRGGGSTRYLNLYEQRLRDEGFEVVRGRRVSGGLPLMVFGEPAQTVCFNPFVDEEQLAELVREAGVRRLVMNHMVDLPGVPLDWAARTAKRLGISYEVILHDYYYVCPRITLVDRDGKYCGLASQAACSSCLSQGEHRDVDIASWRETAGRLLAGACRVIAPSEDLAGRIQGVLPDVAIEVFEPERSVARVLRAQRSLKPGEQLRVAMLGALDEPKGYAVIAELAKWVRATGAPIQLIVIGDTSGTRRLRNLGVTVTGRYREADAPSMLERLAPDVFFFPAIWPETWSFTLTTVLGMGAPIVAFDIGAIGQRLRRAGTGVLLPYDLHRDPAELGRWFIGLRHELRMHRHPSPAPGVQALADGAPQGEPRPATS